MLLYLHCLPFSRTIKLQIFEIADPFILEERICVPMHHSTESITGHWYLLVVDMFDGNGYILDSLQGTQQDQNERPRLQNGGMIFKTYLGSYYLSYVCILIR